MIARLHHELVGNSRRCLALAHGMLGSGPNLRGIAKGIVARRPEWSVALVDLRAHGRSEVGDPPHTIEACAADVVALPIAFDAIAGHSFGGKVALAVRRLKGLEQTWVLDANPGVREPTGTVADVVGLLERLPKTWARRDDFIAAVVAAGHDKPFATWLAMNIHDGALRLDLVAIRALLDDYGHHDAWEAVGPGVELVVADRSAAIGVLDQQRALAAGAHVHHVDAGHWLHVEAPAAVIDLFATTLP